MRPDIDTYWINLTIGASMRATCPRRKVGSIITDIDGHILANGYNGPPKGIPNCIENPCGGHDEVTVENCIAIHAEQNAILQLGERIRYAHTLYTTTFPCFTCAKLICQTSIKRVIFVEDYPDTRGKRLFDAKGVEVTQHVEPR